MKVSELTDALEAVVPRSLAEDFDNVGLLVGDPQAQIERVLLAHDVTLAVLEEAAQKGAGLVISFHPILFSGLKRLAEQTYVARIVSEALRKGIALYALHTNLDNYEKGTNYAMAARLGLKDHRVLLPRLRSLKKLITYVPSAEAEAVREALFRAGAGHIGNYSHCSFNFEGAGSFQAESGAKPFVGKPLARHIERETCVTVVLPAHLEAAVLGALLAVHPYEEAAYEITTLDNLHPRQGMGRIGQLEQALEEQAFLRLLKEKLSLKILRHSALLGRAIKTVAWLGGSGSTAIAAAKAQGADAFVSGDFKYHNFFEAEEKIVLIDAGHYESESLAVRIIRDIIKEKFPMFAVDLSEKYVNPIHYF